MTCQVAILIKFFGTNQSLCAKWFKKSLNEHLTQLFIIHTLKKKLFKKILVKILLKIISIVIRKQI